MRRERFAKVLFMSVAVVFAGATGCNGDKPAPASQTELAAADSDVVSGCVYGAPLVKVLIDLQEKDTHCVAEVTPASVCVAPAGVVRFKIHNGCGKDLGSADREAVKIQVQKFKGLHSAKPEGSASLEIFQNCSLLVPKLSKKANHVLFCDVAGDAYHGFYKYGLSGDIFPLDPDVEVRPGRP